MLDKTKTRKLTRNLEEQVYAAMPFLQGTDRDVLMGSVSSKVCNHAETTCITVK